MRTQDAMPCCVAIAVCGFILALVAFWLLFTALGNSLIDEAQYLSRRLRFGKDELPVPQVYEACRAMLRLAKGGGE